MSSKSRKQSSPKSSKQHPKSEVLPKEEHHESVRVAGVDLSDEFVVVPKERSPLFFLLMIALLIFLLIIFIVPSALLGLAGGGSKAKGTPDYLSYDLPIDGKMVHEELEQTAFVRRRLLIDKVLEIDPLLLLNMGIFGGRANRMEEEDHARLVYLDRLAEASGVYVTKEDVFKHLAAIVNGRAFSGNLEQYKTYFASGRDGITTNEFEGELMRMIRVERFMTMLGDIPSLADPDWIEENWKKDHVEDRFVYAQIEVAGLEEGIRAEGVDDEALGSWFDGLEDFRKEKYRTEEKRVVTLAHVDNVAEFDSSLLLAKYPQTEGVDPAIQADDYYNRVFLDRFRFDPSKDLAGPTVPDTAPDTAPDTGPDTGGETDQQQPENKQFLEFAEVEDIALAEAPVYFALEAWSDDLLDRSLAGEDVDLSAEATALGVPLTTTQALTDSELRELDTLGGDSVADSVRRTAEGNLGATLFVTEDSFGIFHVDSVVPSEIPPLSDVREEVFGEWVVAQAQERALDQLNAIRDGLEEFTPEEDDAHQPLMDKNQKEVSPRRRADDATFRAACEAAGLELGVRDWIDRRGRITDDPASTDPSHIFLRSNQNTKNSRVDEVAPAELDNSLANAFLVRKDGEREVGLERMGPQDYASYKSRSAMSSSSAVRDGLSFEYLQEHFGLKVYDSRSDEERARDEARKQRRAKN